MFLNETKPPLEEVLEHHGIKGMHWGQRRAQKAAYKAQTKAYKQIEKEYNDQAHADRKRKIAIGALTVVGIAATAVVLHKTGNLKIPTHTLTDELLKTAKVTDSEAMRVPVKTSSFESSKGNKLLKDALEAKAGYKNPFLTEDGLGKYGTYSRQAALLEDGGKHVRSFNDTVWTTPIKDIPIKKDSGVASLTRTVQKSAVGNAQFIKDKNGVRLNTTGARAAGLILRNGRWGPK